jgi:hypothetical protein
MNDELVDATQTLGLTKYVRHIFLCADQTEPKCCAKQDGLASWEFLKKRLKELNLVGAEPLVFRSTQNRWFSAAKQTVFASALMGQSPSFILKAHGITPVRPQFWNELFKSI